MFNNKNKTKLGATLKFSFIVVGLLVVAVSVKFVTREYQPPESLSQVINEYYAVDVEDNSITTSIKDELIATKVKNGEIKAETVDIAAELLNEDKVFESDSLIVFPKEDDAKPSLIYLTEEKDREETNLEPTDEEKNQLELSLIALLEDKDISSAQPNYIYETTTWSSGSGIDTPDDFDLTPSPSTGNNWYYELSNLREMWQDLGCAAGEPSCGGNPEVTVAVIDTGLALESRTSAWGDTFGPNTDMFSSNSINLYTNTSETPNDRIDNDGNGYVDDYNGFDAGDYVYCNSNSCNSTQRAEEGHPNDDNGHGTYVSGLVTTLVDNNYGSVSPAHNVTLMPIKANFFHANSFGSLELWYAIDYAVDHGADVINLSLAGPTYDPSLDSKLSWAESQGTIVFAASGNDNTVVYYPAAYSSVVAVAAVDADGDRSTYSNYGSQIDISAYVGSGGGPNTATFQRTYTCFPCSPFTTNFTGFSNKYAIGTSFASPQAAAMAAMVLSVEPTLSKSEVTNYMYTNAIDVGTAGKDNNSGWGALDWEATYLDVYGDNSAPTISIVEPDGTGDSTSDFYTITWTDSDSDNDAEVDIYWDDDTNPNNGKNSIFNCTDISEDDATDSCDFLTWSVPPGSVYIHGCIKDFSHPETCSTSSGPITVSAPASLYNDYYPFYARGVGVSDWIMLGNPSAGDATVYLKVGTSTEEIATANAGEYMTYVPGEFYDGPVEIISDVDLYSSLRSVINGSFNEYGSITSDDFDTEFYYPFYATKTSLGSQDWILVGNPSTSSSVNVNIKIGTSIDQDYVLSPGEKITPKYTNIVDGPVTVTSSGGQVYSTKRTLLNGSFNEYKGISSSDIGTSFSYPFYATSTASGSQDWILVGNPSATVSANINIKVGTSIDQNYVIAPGEKITPKWGVVDGPVEVTSDIDIYSTKRTVINGSFNEHKGIGVNDEKTTFYYPFYATSTASGSQDWILVGNPSASVSANVNIKVGTSVDQNYVLAPGEKITPKYINVVGGPVVITSDINIYSTKRTVLNGSFNEMKGL